MTRDTMPTSATDNPDDRLTEWTKAANIAALVGPETGAGEQAEDRNPA